jgi:hypothetical protein
MDTSYDCRSFRLSDTLTVTIAWSAHHFLPSPASRAEPRPLGLQLSWLAVIPEILHFFFYFFFFRFPPFFFFQSENFSSPFVFLSFSLFFPACFGSFFISVCFRFPSLSFLFPVLLRVSFFSHF